MIREDEQDLDTLMNYIKKRVKSNKNWLSVTTGPPGSAKSYIDLRKAEAWYDYWFHEPFPIENVCFSIEDLMDKLTDKKNREGECFILEESGVLINSKNFQSKINKLFNYYMQSFRCKNLLLLFNLPLMNNLDKSTRLLIHSHFITSKIVKSKQIAYAKPFFLQINQDNEKVYKKYLRKSIKRETYIFKYPIKIMGFGLPSKELLKAYESKKEKFVDDLGESVKHDLKMDKAKRGETITYRMKQINTCYHKYKILSGTKIADKISEWEKSKVYQPTISQVMHKMDALFIEWRENPSKIGFIAPITAES